MEAGESEVILKPGDESLQLVGGLAVTLINRCFLNVSY